MTVLLTITTTHEPATDLGLLLHKHPERVQSFARSVGTAHVFYPERSTRRCTAVLLLEVDPIALVRGRQGRSSSGFALGQYVNDRPYAASSLLAIAIKDVFRTALTGRCDARPELADSALPLEITIPALPCQGGPDLATRLFGPLGWQVAADPIALDPTITSWGESRYLTVRLRGRLRLADALNHLYVLLPVLDDAKHYWVTDDEVDKLIRAGTGWLANHPDAELISSRYLAHQRQLTSTALARLAEIDDTVSEVFESSEEPGADPLRLVDHRHAAVLSAIKASGARRVGDLGCGDGTLLRKLVDDHQLTSIVGTDVSVRALQRAARRLRLDQLSEPQRDRIQLFQSALTYRDDRLTGLDAAVLMEVIEHIDPPRLPAVERNLFGHAAPNTVIITTPNADHNVRFPALAAGSMRHHDHRFEWGRAEFGSWATRVAADWGYTVEHKPVGEVDPDVGAPTQLAVFTKIGSAGSSEKQEA